MVYSGGGAVALDQFVPMLGECPMTQTCDFESGLCGWNPSSGGGQYAFQLIQASNAVWQSDKFDHSTDSSFGHFLEAANGIL